MVRFSALALSIDLALSSSSTNKNGSTEVTQAKELINSHSSLFLNLLDQDCDLESTAATTETVEEVPILVHHLEFYKVKEDTARKLLVLSSAQSKQELDTFLHAVYGYSCFSTTFTSKHSFSLALLFNERRALLIAALNLFSQDSMFAAEKLSLVRNGMLPNARRKAQILHEHIHLLLSNPAHRGALEYQVQIAQLIWERNTLFKLIFLLACKYAREFKPQDLQSLLELLQIISISPGTPTTGGEAISINTSSRGGDEGFVDWVALERSFALDCTQYSMFAVIRTLKLYKDQFPGGEYIVFHDGFKGLVEVAWGFYTLPANIQQRLLQETSELRALAFMRCCMRSSEFHSVQQVQLASPMFSIICSDLLLDLVDWVVEKNWLAAAESSQSDNDEQQDGFVDVLYAPRGTANCDSLEDLMECLVEVLLSNAPTHEYAVAFFTQGTKRHLFLQHCSKFADRAVFCKLLSALLGNGCALQVETLLSAKRFFAETLDMLHQSAAGEQFVRDLSQRLLLLSKLGEFPRHQEFVLPCLEVLADENMQDKIKISALKLITMLSALPQTQAMVLNHWRRHFAFPDVADQGAEVARFQVVQMHTNTLRRTFKLTCAVLEFFRALMLARKRDLPDAQRLLQYTNEVVFLRLDQVNYALPGERWELCAACLQVYATAVETQQGEYWVQTHFLRESELFMKLMDVLRTHGGGKAAEGLAEHCLRATRWPLPNFGSRRPEWFLVGKRASNLALMGNTANSFGMLKTTNQQVSGFVGEWLVSGEEQPFLFDDGDSGCANRLRACQLALHMLTLLMDTEQEFFKWKATKEWSSQLKLSTLLLSHSEIFISATSTFVGFAQDVEMQRMALRVLDHVAVCCSNAEEQVFIWTKPKHFLGTNKMVFDFLCKHRPAVLLKHSVGYLTRVIETSSINSATHSEAVRTLALVPAHERTKFPADALLRQYLEYFTHGYEANAQVLYGMSWTLHILLQRQVAFPFECDLFVIAIQAMPRFPQAATHLVHSWRLYVEKHTHSHLLRLEVLMQTALAKHRLTPECTRDLTRTSLLVFKRIVDSKDMEVMMTNAQAEELALAVADVLCVLDQNKHPQGYAMELSLLVMLCNAAPNRQVVFECLVHKLEPIVDICASICMQTTSDNGLLKSAAAAVFVLLFPLVKHSRLEIYTRRGVFHGMLANLQCAPILAALEFIALTREGTAALVDNLPTGNAFSLLELRLSLTVALNDTRFELRYLTEHKQALLHVLKEYSTPSDWEEARLVVTLFCKLKRRQHGASDDQVDEAVKMCLAAAVRRSLAHNSLDAELGLVRACVLYLAQDVPQQNSSSRRSEVNTLVQLLPMLLARAQHGGEEEDMAVADLERVLLVLFQVLSVGWTATEDFPVLAKLFPKSVGREHLVSSLEQYISTGRSNLLPVVCQKICELRFQ